MCNNLAICTLPISARKDKENLHKILVAPNLVKMFSKIFACDSLLIGDISNKVDLPNECQVEIIKSMFEKLKFDKIFFPIDFHDEIKNILINKVEKKQIVKEKELIYTCNCKKIEIPEKFFNKKVKKNYLTSDNKCVFCKEKLFF